MLFLGLSALVVILGIIIGIVKMCKKHIFMGIMHILIGVMLGAILILVQMSIPVDLADARLVETIKLEQDDNGMYVRYYSADHCYSCGYTNEDGHDVGSFMADDLAIKIIETDCSEAVMYIYEANTSLWIIDELNWNEVKIFVIPDGTFVEIEESIYTDDEAVEETVLPEVPQQEENKTSISAYA